MTNEERFAKMHEIIRCNLDAVDRLPLPETNTDRTAYSRKLNEMSDNITEAADILNQGAMPAHLHRTFMELLARAKVIFSRAAEHAEEQRRRQEEGDS
jgi:hypothetical protein